MPKAIKGKKGVIVYGHGLFTAAKNDFNEAFNYSKSLTLEKILEGIDIKILDAYTHVLHKFLELK